VHSPQVLVLSFLGLVWLLLQLKTGSLQLLLWLPGLVLPLLWLLRLGACFLLLLLPMPSLLF